MKIFVNPDGSIIFTFTLKKKEDDLTLRKLLDATVDIDIVSYQLEAVKNDQSCLTVKPRIDDPQDVIRLQAEFDRLAKEKTDVLDCIQVCISKLSNITITRPSSPEHQPEDKIASSQLMQKLCEKICAPYLETKNSVDAAKACSGIVNAKLSFATNLHVLGDKQQAKDEFEKSLFYYQVAVLFAEAMLNNEAATQRFIARTYFDIMFVYRQLLKRSDLALENLEKATKAMQRVKPLSPEDEQFIADCEKCKKDIEQNKATQFKTIKMTSQADYSKYSRLDDDGVRLVVIHNGQTYDLEDDEVHAKLVEILLDKQDDENKLVELMLSADVSESTFKKIFLKLGGYNAIPKIRKRLQDILEKLTAEKSTTDDYIKIEELKEKISDANAAIQKLEESKQLAGNVAKISASTFETTPAPPNIDNFSLDNIDALLLQAKNLADEIISLIEKLDILLTTPREQKLSSRDEKKLAEYQNNRAKHQEFAQNYLKKIENDFGLTQLRADYSSLKGKTGKVDFQVYRTNRIKLQNYLSNKNNVHVPLENLRNKLRSLVKLLTPKPKETTAQPLPPTTPENPSTPATTSTAEMTEEPIVVTINPEKSVTTIATLPSKQETTDATTSSTAKAMPSSASATHRPHRRRPQTRSDNAPSYPKHGNQQPHKDTPSTKKTTPHTQPTNQAPVSGGKVWRPKTNRDSNAAGTNSDNWRAPENKAKSDSDRKKYRASGTSQHPKKSNLQATVPKPASPETLMTTKRKNVKSANLQPRTGSAVPQQPPAPPPAPPPTHTDNSSETLQMFSPNDLPVISEPTLELPALPPASASQPPQMQPAHVSNSMPATLNMAPKNHLSTLFAVIPTSSVSSPTTTSQPPQFTNHRSSSPTFFVAGPKPHTPPITSQPPQRTPAPANNMLEKLNTGPNLQTNFALTFSLNKPSF